MYGIFEHKLELKIKGNVLQVKDCELICFMKIY